MSDDIVAQEFIVPLRGPMIRLVMTPNTYRLGYFNEDRTNLVVLSEGRFPSQDDEVERLRTAEQIVRALAAVEDPTVPNQDYAPAADCGLCEASDPLGYVHFIGDPDRHEPTCPWRLAREWVRALGDET